MSAPPSPARTAFIDPSLLGANAAAAPSASLTPVRSRQQQREQQQQSRKPEKADAALASSIAAISQPPRSAVPHSSPASSPPRVVEAREEKAQKRPNLGGPAQRVAMPAFKSGAAAAANSAAAAAASPARAVTPTSPARLPNVASPSRASPRVDPAEAAELRARKQQEDADAAFVRRLVDEEGGVEAIKSDDDARHSPAAGARRSARKRANSDDEGSQYEPDETSPSALARKQLGRAPPPALSASKRARVDAGAAAAAASGPKANARTRKLASLVQTIPDMSDDDNESVEVVDTAARAPASSKVVAPPALTRAHATAERGAAAPAAAAAAGSSIAALPVSAPLAVSGQQLLLSAYNRQGGSVPVDREKAKEKAARVTHKERGEMSLVEMAKLYHLDVPPCGGPSTKKACPHRPNCLHGLGYRRKQHGSIWMAHPSHLSSLGPDPSASKRGEGRGHAGLKNLGALCYLNTLFQTLFMNEHFRRGIYKFRSKVQRDEAAVAAKKHLKGEEQEEVPMPQESKMDVEAAAMDVKSAQHEDDADAIVSELQSLFARLEFGKASFEDPCRIVSKLKLSRGEQQDVNEFNNLFLQHLEARLKLTEIPGVATLIDDEFRGSITHAVTCSSCQTVSQKPSPFYDLTLQIQRKKTVQQAMLAAMQKEPLDGGNKYRCGKCMSPQNAVRSTVITQLPPVLNLQLLRFAYDPLSDSKKKLSDNISIPARIDMAPFKSEEQIEQMVQVQAWEDAQKKNGAGDGAAAAAESAARPVSPAVRKTGAPVGAPSSPAMRGSSSSATASSSSADIYELTAILRHKGTSAYHGHYIADIRDPQDREKWWRFDDDKCTPLAALDDGSGAAKPAEGDDKKKSAGGKKGKAKKGAKKPKSGAASGSEEDDDEEDDDFEADADIAAAAAAAAKTKDDDVVIVDDEEKSVAAPASPIVIDGDETEEKSKGGEKKKLAPSLANISSRNAYMLVYTRVGRPAAPVITRADLTPAMEMQIHESDEGLKKRVAEWIERKEKLEELIENRKKKCEDVWNVAQADEIPSSNPHDLLPLSKGMSPSESMQWRQRVILNPAEAQADHTQKQLQDSVFINAQWLTAWFTGLTEEVEYKTGRFKGSKDDAIDLSGEDEQLRAATEASKREAEEHAAKQKAKQEADEAEAIRRSTEDTAMKPIAEEKEGEDGALIVEDTPMDAGAASWSCAATVASSSSAAAAVAAPSSPRPPPQPILMHPLWPGDLHDSLLQLYCAHNRPDPRNPNLKRITRAAWDLLAHDNELQKRRLMKDFQETHPETAARWDQWVKEQDKALGKPDADSAEAQDPLRAAAALPATELCQVCCNELSIEHDHQDDSQRRRNKLLAMFVNRKDLDEWRIGVREHSAMLVSKLFLKKWQTKATSEVQSKKFTQQSDTEDANYHLVCTHKALATDRFKNREVVPWSFWEELVSFYPKSTPFARDTLPCPQCVVLEARADSSYDNWFEKRGRDLEAMPSMLKQLHIDFPGAKPPNTIEWYLVPGQWAADMHKHLRATDKVDLPKWLNTTTLLCKHGKLLFNPVPRHFVPRHARPAPYDLPGTDVGDLGLMAPMAWEQVRKYKKYFRDEDKPMPPVKLRVSKSQPQQHARIDFAGVPHDPSDWNTVLVTTEPAPCPDCVMDRLQKAEAERIGWEVGQLQIKVMVSGEKLPDATDAADGASSRPKRSTRAKLKEPDLIADFTPDPIAITSKSTLMELKLLAMQNSSIVPGQQDLFLKGKLLQGDDLTLAQLEVPADAVIYIRVNLDGDADIPFAEVEPSERRKRPARPEAGFSGTALSSGMPKARATTPASGSALGAAAATATAAAASSESSVSPSSPAAAASSAAASSASALLPPPLSPSPVAAAPPKPKSSWACSFCTFEHANLTALACEMCGQTRRK